MHRLAAVIALLLPLTAPAAEPARIYGYAFDLETDRFLYTEVHDRTFDGERMVAETVRYVMPDGSVFGEKHLDFRADPFVPEYVLNLSREGYREGVEDNAGPIVVMRQKPGGTAAKESFDKGGAQVADAGLMWFLRKNLDALQRGETLSFRVVAPMRLGSYKFRAVRDGETMFEERKAVQVRVDMDSMLKLFAGSLWFTFDSERRHLLEFRGPTNVRNPATGKDYHVRLAFYAKPPKDAPPLPAGL